jgi:hypothetical protein
MVRKIVDGDSFPKRVICVVKSWPRAEVAKSRIIVRRAGRDDFLNIIFMLASV